MFTLLDGHLFQIGNIQIGTSAYFLILSSFQNFQLVIDAVSLLTDPHLDIFLEYPFGLMTADSHHFTVVKHTSLVEIRAYLRIEVSGGRAPSLL